MTEKRKFYLFLIIAAVALLVNVGSYGVIESSDARYAEIARKMFVTGDYIHPNLLEVHHYHKPPFTYQITALGYKLFGVSPFGARFFLQIAVIIQLVIIYRLSFLLFKNKQTALWSAVIYFSFPMVLIASRNLTTDAFLATFALLGITAWVNYRQSGKWRWLYFFTLALGFGFLTKGPVIFIVPVIFIAFYNLTEPAKRTFSFHHFLAWLLFIGVAGSWFFYLAWQNPNFIDYFLGRQTADRFAKNAFNRTEPFWYFLAFAPLMGLPWFANGGVLLQKTTSFFKFKGVHFALLMAFIVPLVFFSVSSSKRILYILPMYSVLAVLIGHLYQRANKNQVGTIQKITVVFTGLICVALSILNWLPLDFTLPYWFVVLALLGLMTIVFVSRNNKIPYKTKPIATTLVLAVLLAMGSAAFFADNELKVNGVRPVVDFMIENDLQDRKVIVYNSRKPSIAFGLNKPIISLNNGDESLARETQFETNDDFKKYLIDLQDPKRIDNLKKLVATPSVLLVYKRPVSEEFQWLLAKYPHQKKIGKWTVYY